MLEHVNFTVSNLQRSLDFYREAFGFEVRWQGEIFNTTRMTPAAHVGPPGKPFYFSLFEGESSERAPYTYGPPGINHFGLAVDDLAAAEARAQAAGAEVKQAAQYDPGRRVYVMDPDGIEIELVEYS
jgi:catechol 2,3-dioxygenase-like lactoylglutathione lyase family enzyme